MNSEIPILSRYLYAPPGGWAERRVRSAGGLTADDRRGSSQTYAPVYLVRGYTWFRKKDSVLMLLANPDHGALVPGLKVVEGLNTGTAAGRAVVSPDPPPAPLDGTRGNISYLV